jgi:hypothetical protein
MSIHTHHIWSYAIYFGLFSGCGGCQNHLADFDRAFCIDGYVHVANDHSDEQIRAGDAGSQCVVLQK